MDDENKLPVDVPAKVEKPDSLSSNDKNEVKVESNSSIVCGNRIENRTCSPQNASSVEKIHGDLLNKVSDCLESISVAACVSDDKGLVFLFIS